LAMKRSKGLFHRAVLESGPFASWTARTLNVAIVQYHQMAKNVGCESDSHHDSKKVLQCMREKSVEDLMKSKPPCTSGCCFSPTVDGSELERDPQQLAKEHLLSNNVPVMLGSTLDEDNTFNMLPHNVSVSAYEELVKQTFPQIYQQVLRLYPAQNFPLPWFAVSAIYRDLSFVCPARRSAHWLTEAGVPVYLYYWTHVINITKSKIFLGAFHGVEIPFIFYLPDGLDVDGVTLAWTPDEKQLQKNIVNYWKNFAKAGDPNGQMLTNWPKYQTSNDMNIILNVTMSTNQGLKKMECDFWDKFAAGK